MIKNESSFDSCLNALQQIRANNATELLKNDDCLALLKAAAVSADSLFLTAYDTLNPRKPVATGYVTKSLHDYSHWGLNLLAVDPIYANSSEVTKLISNLVSHIERKHNQYIENPYAQEPQLVRKYPTPFLAISGCTEHPGIFEDHGFTSVHYHYNQAGAQEHLLYRISGGPTNFYSIGFSEPTVLPYMHPHVRILESALDISQAAQIITEEWGSESAIDFHSEYKIINNMPGSAFYAVYNDENKVCGVGAIIKALHDENIWSRAWIVVSHELRGNGYGSDLIQGLLAHADEQHPRFSDNPMIMEGFTYIPEYYKKFGNLPCVQINTANERGYPTWTARITQHPSAMNLSHHSFTPITKE